MGLGRLGRRYFPDQIKAVTLFKAVNPWVRCAFGNVLLSRPTINTMRLAQMLRCLSLLTHLYYYASHVDILRSADTSTFSFRPTIDCIWIVSSPLILIIRNRDILQVLKETLLQIDVGCIFILSLTNFRQILQPFLQIDVWDQFAHLSRPWSIGPY